MAKKTQAQTPPQTPEEIAQAFMQLWQEKWNDTLKQKGWPEGAPMPGLGQMPFFNPFMPMNSFTAPTPAADDATLKKMEARIAELEKQLKAKTAPVKKAALKKPAAKKTAQKRKTK